MEDMTKAILIIISLISFNTFAAKYSLCYCKEDLKNFKTTSVISIYGEDSNANTIKVKELLRGPRFSMYPVLKKVKRRCKKEIKKLIRKKVCKYRDSVLKTYKK